MDFLQRDWVTMKRGMLTTQWVIPGCKSSAVVDAGLLLSGIVEFKNFNQCFDVFFSMSAFANNIDAIKVSNRLENSCQ
jgi:hypothetical protein